MNTYTVSKVSDESGWSKLRENWDELVKESHFNDIFMTYEWLAVTWKIFGNGVLFIVLIEDKGKLIGILPLYRYQAGPARILRLIGTGVSDYGSFIFHREYSIDELLNFSIDFLLKDREWDVIDLQQIPDDSPMYQALMDFQVKNNKSKKFFFAKREMVKCPYISFGKNKRTFEAEVNKTMLRKVRGREKLVNARTNSGFKFELTDPFKDRSLDAFFEIHVKRWEASGQDSIFKHDTCRCFFRELAEQLGKNGWLYMPALKLEGEYAAIEYAFSYNNKMYDYSSAYETKFEEFFPGLVLKKYMVYSNLDGSVEEFDFLRGDEKYKYKWTKHIRINYRFLIFRKNFCGLLVCFLWETKNRLRQVTICRKAVSMYRNLKKSIVKIIRGAAKLWGDRS